MRLRHKDAVAACDRGAKQNARRVRAPARGRRDFDNGHAGFKARVPEGVLPAEEPGAESVVLERKWGPAFAGSDSD